MPPRSSRKLLLPTIVLVVGTLLVGLVSGVELYRWALLRDADTVVEAHVTAEELSPCSGKGCVGNDGPYRIRYQFNAASGSGAVYFYTGQMLFAERWARVTKHIWDPAARSGKINVVYAPSDPRINQPAALPRPTAFNAFGLASLAFLMAVVSGAYWRGHKV